jgi:hypothetical protein
MLQPPNADGYTAAFSLAARHGWHVVALRPSSKLPLLPGVASLDCPTEARALLRAAGASYSGPAGPGEINPSNILRIAALLRDGNYNVGYECGTVSRLAVLDLDWRTEIYPSVQQAVHDLPITRTVLTPSGGFHHYITLPHELDPAATSTLRVPGVDLQMRGAFVAAPPSRTSKGAYTEQMYAPGMRAITNDELASLRALLITIHKRHIAEHGDFSVYPLFDPPNTIPAGARDQAVFSAALQMSRWPTHAAHAYIAHILFPSIEQPSGDDFPIDMCYAKLRRAQDRTCPDRDDYVAALCVFERNRPDIAAILPKP